MVFSGRPPELTQKAGFSALFLSSSCHRLTYGPVLTYTWVPQSHPFLIPPCPYSALPSTSIISLSCHNITLQRPVPWTKCSSADIPGSQLYICHLPGMGTHFGWLWLLSLISISMPNSVSQMAYILLIAHHGIISFSPKCALETHSLSTWNTFKGTVFFNLNSPSISRKYFSFYLV